MLSISIYIYIYIYTYTHTHIRIHFYIFHGFLHTLVFGSFLGLLAIFHPNGATRPPGPRTPRMETRPKATRGPADRKGPDTASTFPILLQPESHCYYFHNLRTTIPGPELLGTRTEHVAHGPSLIKGGISKNAFLAFWIPEAVRS